MSNRKELLAQMQETQIRALAIEHQREAIRKLFDAATMMNNSSLSEGYRIQLHDLLDVQLDTAASLMQLTRSILSNPE